MTKPATLIEVARIAGVSTATVNRVLKGAGYGHVVSAITANPFFAIEPLNTRIDHKGYYLSSTAEGLDIIDDVGRPEIRIVYDIYHSAVMDEEIGDVLAGRLDGVAHVHLADAPGRHEPGSGTMDWQRRVAWLAANGYIGMVGLEYMPTKGTVASLEQLLGPLE